MIEKIEFELTFSVSTGYKVRCSAIPAQEPKIENKLIPTYFLYHPVKIGVDFSPDFVDDLPATQCFKSDIEFVSLSSQSINSSVIIGS